MASNCWWQEIEDYIEARPDERGLMSAVLLQAIGDLSSDDFDVAHDAYLWLLEDGPLYMDALGMATDIRAWAIEHWKALRPETETA